MRRINLYLFSFLFLLFISASLRGQEIDYSKWRDHLPYNNCIAVEDAGNLVYAATPYSVFYFNKTDNSLTRLNKVTADGLSDIGISALAYSDQYKTLVVAYSNTNVDLVIDSKVTNIPDIKRKQIVGNKTINQVQIIGKLAYLACGFGIVVVDIERKEIKDTYYIGPSGSQINVRALTFHPIENKFYAATEQGIFSALATDNLAYYVNWTKDTTIAGYNDNFNLIASFGNKIYVNKTKGTWDSDDMFVKDGTNWSSFMPDNVSNRTSMRVCGDKLLVSNYLAVDVFKNDGSFESRYYSYNPGTIRPNSAILDQEKTLWVADNDQGLWSIGTANTGTKYIFNGPVSAMTAAMDISGRQVWAVPGARSAGFTPLYNIAQFYTLKDNTWSSFNSTNIPALNDIRDVLCVAADPKNSNHAFLGTWGYGVIELENGQWKNIYKPSNSSLQYIDGYGDGYLRVGGLVFDQNNNLWVTNSNVTKTLSVRKADGTWKSFNLGSKSNQADFGNIVIDQSNQKWMQMRDMSLFVFNDNNTIDNIADDQYKKLTTDAGDGNLHGSSIACMAVDRDGQLWLGTDQGVQVIYSPSNVFNGGSFDAQQVMIEENGYLYPLLGSEAVTAIAVNGNNEKWLGTDKSGVFLMSSDGTLELEHYTEANSPLLSNSIQSIKIAENGEVFFATANGIVSFRDYKVESKPTFDSLTIYPNPVRPGYSGPIYISNLVAESTIKITDASGGLVWQTEAQGGQVIWDGNNLENRKVNTGVYLIFVTNSDGSQKKVGKLLFVR